MVQDALMTMTENIDRPMIAASDADFRDDARMRLPLEVLARYTAISAWR